jgi:hypothetical protein
MGHQIAPARPYARRQIMPAMLARKANHNGEFHISIFKNTTLALGMNETLCLNGEFHFTVSKANQYN